SGIRADQPMRILHREGSKEPAAMFVGVANLGIRLSNIRRAITEAEGIRSYRVARIRVDGSGAVKVRGQRRITVIGRDAELGSGRQIRRADRVAAKGEATRVGKTVRHLIVGGGGSSADVRDIGALRDPGI